jgi:hypothetical protein
MPAPAGVRATHSPLPAAPPTDVPAVGARSRIVEATGLSGVVIGAMT